MPRGTRDLVATLAQEGVIQQGHEGLVFGEAFDHGPAGHREQPIEVEASLGEQAVGSGPIDELPATGCQQTGDGATSQGHQGGQRKTIRPTMGAVLGKRRTGLFPQGIKEANQRLSRFFWRW